MISVGRDVGERDDVGGFAPEPPEYEDVEEARAMQRREGRAAPEEDTDDETLAEEDIVEEVDLDAAPWGEGPDA